MSKKHYSAKDIISKGLFETYASCDAGALSEDEVSNISLMPSDRSSEDLSADDEDVENDDYRQQLLGAERHQQHQPQLSPPLPQISTAIAEYQDAFQDLSLEITNRGEESASDWLNHQLSLFAYAPAQQVNVVFILE